MNFGCSEPYCRLLDLAFWLLDLAFSTFNYIANCNNKEYYYQQTHICSKHNNVAKFIHNQLEHTLIKIWTCPWTLELASCGNLAIGRNLNFLVKEAEQFEWAFSEPFCVSLLNLFPTFQVDQLETAFASQKLSQESPAPALLCGYLLFFSHDSKSHFHST